MADDELRAKREKIVLDHFADEVRQQWDDVLSTFPHPRYEIVPTGEVYDGDEAVRGYYHKTRVAFPDQHHEMIQLRHSDDTVICEFYLKGTHLGPFGAIPATGQPFQVQVTALFVFDGEELVCERVYFDVLTLIKQLLRGRSIRKPSDWPFMFRLLRGLRRQLL